MRASRAGATGAPGPGRPELAPPAYWTYDAATLPAALGSGPEALPGPEAAARLARLGPNAIRPPARLGAAVQFLSQLKSPLVLILLFGAAISAVLHEWVDAAIVLAIVMGCSVLGFTQEYRASRAIEQRAAASRRSCA